MDSLGEGKNMNLKQSKFYFNRELSWLKFNDRVLEEAQDSSHPLLERLKFISIFSSNLDEFFMIRVAGLKEQIHAGVSDIQADGLGPEELVARISVHVHQAFALQAKTLEKDILPSLKKKGIRLRQVSSIRNVQRDFVSSYFREQVFPVLTPLAIDPAHPFPQLKSLGLNLLVDLRTPYKKDSKIAVIHIPSSLPRLIQLPTENGTSDFILIEELIKANISSLFPNMKVVAVSEFRVTRNADLDLSEAEADDLLKLIERELRKRRLGTVIRLEVTSNMSKLNRDFLKGICGLQEEDVYDVKSYLDLAAFMQLQGLSYPELKDPKFNPALNQRIVGEGNIFKAIRKGDILLHHPYDSFNHVAELIQEAAKDPHVLAIKQTLYRTNGESSIVKALKEAVQNGKQVTALIELKARFDEKNNIEWAKELDLAGVNVVYGVLGLKTHCKICMIVRSEKQKIRRYIHLSTGNYNEKTAKIYTDIGLLTCNDQMGEDASSLFNLLTGYSQQKEWNTFLVAPTTLRSSITNFIHECIKNHNEDQPARIIFVINSLVDPEIIRELYKASMKGVQIELIVRGICCLKPGIKGLSENITVKSIVGRFLEHTRIFYFKHSGQSKIFMGSADLMQRNLNRRVELVFPIEDPSIKQQVKEILDYMMQDNVKSRYLSSDGSYAKRKIDTGEQKLNVQEFLLAQSRERQKSLDTIESKKF